MMNETEPKRYAIAASTLFADLDTDQRQRLEQIVMYHTYSPGQLFHSPYERSEQLFILQEGRVRLYKLSSEGRALTLGVLEPVTVFGEMSLVGESLHDSFAEAMTHCIIGVIRHDTLQELLQTNPHMVLSFMDLMGRRLRDIENKLADIAFKSVPQRLASVLLNLADGAASAALAATASPSVVRYTHQQLAEMIGSYRETVTKAIGEFREAGLIEVDDESIHLTNLEELRQLAHK